MLSDVVRVVLRSWFRWIVHWVHLPPGWAGCGQPGVVQQRLMVAAIGVRFYTCRRPTRGFRSAPAF
jgi:hypothetical protein